MLEFGSDFHLIEEYTGVPAGILKRHPSLLASGRMALALAFNATGCRRLWVPQYFCYEVLDYLTNIGIEWTTYPDCPEACDDSLIQNIDFVDGDALLRMNYFGLRRKRHNSKIPVPVIEDHSHGLLSAWANDSDADYCIASIRKTMPLPEGGIIWSPKGLGLPEISPSSIENEILVDTRLKAMEAKAKYLHGENIIKDSFREQYIRSEDMFDSLQSCSISDKCLSLLNHLDFAAFDRQKKRNWDLLTKRLSPDISYLIPEVADDTPFSLVLKFDSESRMMQIRNRLIADNIYPAVLWPLPVAYSRDMPHYLSVHCDGRYTSEDIEVLANRINDTYRY